MTDASVTPAAKTPIWFYLVALVAVLWNAMGVFDYIMTQYRVESYMAAFTEAQLDYFYGFPGWYVAVWATAVFSALGASLLLVVRMKLATPLFALSAVLFVISAVYIFGFTAALEIMGMGNVVFSAVIFATLLGLWWFSRMAERRGWLK
ncbi:hypothetical protein ACWCOP_00680 [Maricaulaceae bacterium MS644]